MTAALEIIANYPNVKLIRDSPTELLNIFRADAYRLPIIMMTSGILAKTEPGRKEPCRTILDTGFTF